MQMPSRATKIYQSFTAGLNRNESDKSLFTNGLTGLGTKKNKREADDEKISEDEKQRIMKILEEESSSEDDDDTSEDQDSQVE